MKAFSRIPPFDYVKSPVSQQKVIHLKIPIGTAIQVDALNQTKKPTKQRARHIISNPNQLKSNIEEMNREQKLTIINEEQKNVVDSVISLSKTCGKNQQKEKGEKKNKQMNSEQVIPYRSAVKIFEVKKQDHSPSPQSQFKQISQISPISHKNVYQQSHILFSASEAKSHAILFRKKPIFQKKIQQNIAKSNVVAMEESVVKKYENLVIHKPTYTHDYFNNQDSAHQESHIECGFFGNEAKPNQSSFHQTGLSLNSPQPEQKVSKHSQKNDHSILGSEGQTSDKELYQSYSQNRDKIKKLGGRPSSHKSQKNKQKQNPQKMKLQITKLVSIEPIQF